MICQKEVCVIKQKGREVLTKIKKCESRTLLRLVLLTNSKPPKDMTAHRLEIMSTIQTMEHVKRTTCKLTKLYKSGLNSLCLCILHLLGVRVPALSFQHRLCIKRKVSTTGKDYHMIVD